MKNEKDESINKSVDVVAESEDASVSTEEVSQATMEAFKNLADEFGNEFDIPDDESLLEEEPLVEAERESLSSDYLDDVEIKWGPDIDLSHETISEDNTGPAQDNSSPESDSHEELTSDFPGSSETTDTEIKSSDEDIIDSGNTGFGRAASASDFLNAKMSMNDLVQEIAAKAFNQSQSPLAEANIRSGPVSSPQPQANPVQGNGTYMGQSEPYPRMGLGSASMLLGAKGLQGLAKMIGSGGRSVGTAISDFSFGNAEKELGAAISAARAGIAEMKLGGLSVLEEDALPLDSKKELLKQYLSSPENQKKFDSLVSKIDSFSELSAKVMRKGIDRGMDGDAVMNKAIDPVHRFMKDNESILKNLYSGDKTLHERLEGAVTALFEMLRDVLAHIQAMFSGQSPDQSQSGPRMG
ncbi:hypothetical protein ALQ64_01967 [Pseudomonas cannabina]|uniref:Uncharacterized protein n=1 Tax=Pseudomonas cannabina TaxID=86840 RepID=A0A3M3LQI5_PSECA|nr:hypothetical protein [Pseudomonas cannabina]RMN37398.1 hypothetical protein ALQ64_01967 [Pseudomonas cannabina]